MTTAKVRERGPDMAKEDEALTPNDNEGASERTFTQAELDEKIKERLRREREKYADYEELRAKAAKFDEAEEASKTELQKATERAEALQKELDGYRAAQARRDLVATIAAETGADADLLSAMAGDDEETIRANAQLVKEKFSAVPGYRPDPHDNGGPKPDAPKRDIPTIF